MSLHNRTIRLLTNLALKTHRKTILPCSLHTTRALDGVIAFNLSDIGEGIREVVVKEWFVKEGDKVNQFDDICEVQSDKASVTITSRYDGVIKKLHYDIDKIALVGKPLVDIETAENNDGEVQDLTPKEPEIIDVPVQKTTENDSTSYAQCIPSVRRLAKEHKINLSLISGTGKHGRILKEDVLKFMNKPTNSNTLNAVLGEDTVQPIRGFQKAMVKTMTESLKIPHFVYSDEISVTKLSKLRKTLKNIPDLDVKISFMPFFIKAASKSLEKYPVLNSTIDETCENITFKKSHNIGIAMDTKIGLAVPVIKNVQDLSVLQIAKELNRLMKNGKEGSFSPSDLTGGTFSISNIGAIGGTYTKPVILPPQVAIIALGTVKLTPKFDDKMNVIAEEIVNISAAADHRVVDGATMANFTNLAKKYIENPYLLLLDV